MVKEADALAGALKQCEPCFQLTLVGDIQEGYEHKLKGLLPEKWRGRVRFRKQLKSAEVLGLVGKFHIGLALERLDPESRNLTVTNKILQYLLGGLAVVATRTRGQEEVAQAAKGAVRLAEQGDENQLAEALTGWARNAEELQQARQAARKAAEEKFCWEVEARKLRLS